MVSNVSIGILGGGQLGKMLIQKANQLGLNVAFLENSAQCPAASVTKNHFIGDITNYGDVVDFGKKHSHLTVEIENVNLNALKDLEKSGIVVHPKPAILELIKNKGRQKNFYAKHNIPTAPYAIFANKRELAEYLNHNNNYPIVLKATEGGYDGKGVWILNNRTEFTQLPDIEYIIEEKIEIEKELAVICCGNKTGISTFETVEMVFDNSANLVDFILHPAQIHPDIEKRTQDIAKNVCAKFGIQGLLAVELFLTPQGEILVNEVAPRPHNSGHHTIESHSISQYEAHLRGLLSLNITNNKSNVPYAAMINLLGDNAYEGTAHIHGITSILDCDGAQLHWYGKKDTKAKRKMGHITVVSNNLSELLNKCKVLKNDVKIISQ